MGLLQTRYIVDDLPDLPIYEGTTPVTNPKDLSSYDPPFGHEYGFDKYGLRLDLQTLDTLGVRGWPISKVAKLVDVITWANVDDPMLKNSFIQLFTLNKDRSNDVTFLGNLAYTALNTTDLKYKATLCSVLREHGVVVEDDQDENNQDKDSYDVDSQDTNSQSVDSQDS